MRKTQAQLIDYTNLKPGEVYRVRIPALGEVLARLIDKEQLLFEITQGKLQSQADRRKTWQRGQTFEATSGMCTFWEIL